MRWSVRHPYLRLADSNFESFFPVQGRTEIVLGEGGLLGLRGETVADTSLQVLLLRQERAWKFRAESRRSTAPESFPESAGQSPDSLLHFSLGCSRLLVRVPRHSVLLFYIRTVRRVHTGESFRRVVPEQQESDEVAARNRTTFRPSRRVLRRLIGSRLRRLCALTYCIMTKT